MHWGQIKTLLILSFLILDIYLFMQFLEKKEVADIGVIEHEPSTIEEQLNGESITIKELPDQEYEETYISLKQHLFTKDELKGLSNVPKQESFILNQNMVVSILDKAIALPSKKTDENMDDFLTSFAYYGEEYTFWKRNEEKNVLVYFQNKLDRTIYYNDKGIILVFLNDDNEATHYIQTMLGEEETVAEKRKLITPMRAIETLYNANALFAGDEITRVNIGFHTRVPFESDVQVFVPIWKITVNEDHNYFVNAIEGFIFSTDEEEFFDEVTTTMMKRLDIQKGQNKKLEEILQDIEVRKGIR